MFAADAPWKPFARNYISATCFLMMPDTFLYHKTFIITYKMNKKTFIKGEVKNIIGFNKELSAEGFES